MQGTRAVAPAFNENGLFHPPCPLASQTVSSQGHTMLRLELCDSDPSFTLPGAHKAEWGGLWREKGCSDGKGTVISSRGAVSRCWGFGVGSSGDGALPVGL